MHLRRFPVGMLLIALLCTAFGNRTASAQPVGPRLQRGGPLPVPAHAVYAPGELIVGLQVDSLLARHARGANTALTAHFAALGVRTVTSIAPDAYRLTVNGDVLALARRLAADPGVRYAEPNYIYVASRGVPNDPLYSFQYAPNRINLQAAWDISTGSNGVVIAVIDTGVNALHPDLVGRTLPGFNFVDGNDDPDDDDFHGTFVTGIVGASGDNGLGIAGVCWQCRVLPIRSLGSRGGTAGSVAQGIRYAVDRGARIINMSLGGAFDSSLLRDAVAYATSKNVLLVAASGNGAQQGNYVEYPAAYAGVLSVGATDGDDRIAGFSTHNASVQLTAPGVNIASTANDQDLDAYGAYDGTSFAAPIVAGIAGLMLSVNPSLSAEQLKALLNSTAVDLGLPGRDEFYGVGRVDAGRAVQAAVPSAFVPMANPNQAGVTFFPATAHSLRGDFARFWNANGGLAVFGYPISEEFNETTAEGTFRVQYFERERLELHPENPASRRILLGRLGDLALLRSGRDWRRFERGEPGDPECRFFIETGHNVCGLFQEYWESNGLADPSLEGTQASLQLFGLPLSEAQEEVNSSGDAVVVQWFERARFEYHPELPEEYAVSLGLLGSETGRPVFGGPAPITAGPVIQRCNGLGAPRNAAITPGGCVLFGTTITMTIRGFQPGEKIAYWLTDPNGEVQGSEDEEDLLVAGADGTLGDLSFPTSFLDTGDWFWVFQGATSGTQSVVPFRIIDG